ncbi:NAD(P)-dependent dehydrogenase (short-subunit alcohol dehydrogenase family) [Streptomyces sp. W4I9-2]|nr:NAD(P)-dependent dehydrogenase (short-subunit alcohol dehydrogenase family) [Streptomyces sp. W4I9-2]
MRALGRAAVTVAVDTADAADVDRLFDTAAVQLGPVTGLVNNAGVSGPVGPLAGADPEGMRQALEVTPWATCCASAGPSATWRRAGRS